MSERLTITRIGPCPILDIMVDHIIVLLRNMPDGTTDEQRARSIANYVLHFGDHEVFKDHDTPQ